MACWSAENATKAFLRALKMGKGSKEPDIGEFISALAAGNNVQLMVMACAGAAASGTTALALVAAAHQTGGKVVCILPSQKDLNPSKISLGHYAGCVEFAVGNAKTLLLKKYNGADFVLIDCGLSDHEELFQGARKGFSRALIVGYNALMKGSNWGSDLRERTQFLPIGEGLLVSRYSSSNSGTIDVKVDTKLGCPKTSHWVVKVDKCTGEEHVFRVTSPRRQRIQAY